MAPMVAGDCILSQTAHRAAELAQYIDQLGL